MTACTCPAPCEKHDGPRRRLRWLRETHDLGIPFDVAIAAAPLLPKLDPALLSRMRTRRTCSWCDAMNEMPADGSPVFCSSCGHRGDVARMHCTCGRLGCRGAVSQ